MADISMNLDDTLELDAIIKDSTEVTSVINAKNGNESTDFNLEGFQTHTGVFDPINSGTYNLDVNGQELTIKVTDTDSTLSSTIARYDAQESFSGNGGTNTSTIPDLVSGYDLTGDSVKIESNGINSYPGIHYDRQQQGSSSIPISTPFTTITVFKNNETGDTGGDEDTAYGQKKTQYNLDKGGTWAATGTNGHVNSGLEPVESKIVTVVWDSNEVRHRILSFDNNGNTSLDFSGSKDIINSYNRSGWSLGGGYSEDSGDSNITVGEHIIYDEKLSNTAYENEEDRLGQKWS
jgi:hypothetical protein